MGENLDMQGGRVLLSVLMASALVMTIKAAPFFSVEAEDWRTTLNYEGCVEASARPLEGKMAFVITKNKNGHDTQWEIESPKFAVDGGKFVAVRLRTRSTVSMMFSVPFHGRANTCLRYFDRDGKCLTGDDKPLYFPVSTDWTNVIIGCAVPTNAAMAVVLIGGDRPDVGKDDRIEISEVKVAYADAARFAERPKGAAGQEPRYTLREDGVVLDRGVPFFPIGIYAVSKREFNNFSFDRALKGLKDAGFNVAHAYCVSAGDEFADLAANAMKYDMRLIVSPRVAGGVVEGVRRARHNSPILAWYLGDDTSTHTTPEVLREDHDICHLLDKAHFTCQADGVGEGVNGSYNRFAGCTDVFLPEIYPVSGDDGRAAAAEVVKNMETVREILKKQTVPKSVWPIIQYYHGWGTSRFPTFAELRAMSFLALIHGGRGITWYTYGGYNGNLGVWATAETWSNICTVAGQIASIRDYLVGKDGPGPAIQIMEGAKKDPLGFDSVTALIKRGTSKDLLIAANASTGPVKVRFGLSGYKGVREVFEKRRCALAEGSFSDEYETFAVHVYELDR